MSGLTAAELQSMYQTVLDTVFPDTCDVYDSGDTQTHSGVQCTVSDAATVVEWNDTAGAYMYEGVYTVRVPKWVEVELSGYIDVLGMKLKIKSLEEPKSNQMSKTMRCNYSGTGSTSPTVPPYDLLTTSNQPITSGGVGVRLQ